MVNINWMPSLHCKIPKNTIPVSSFRVVEIQILRLGFMPNKDPLWVFFFYIMHICSDIYLCYMCVSSVPNEQRKCNDRVLMSVCSVC